MMMKQNKICRFIVKFAVIIVLMCSFAILNKANVYATTITEGNQGVVNNTDNSSDNILGINISTNEDGGLSGALQIVLVLTVIALCPSILIMLTSFTRIIIVLHFTRAALNTQSAPPNQVLVGLALFLTFFAMAPVFNQVNAEAIQPLNNGDITAKQAYEAGIEPIRNFMFNNVRDEDLDTMCSLAGLESVSQKEDIPTRVLIPSFMMSELRIAFWIGFMIYIPFLVIDMVVSATLMSMGMMMLPPTTISMPFKILLFVLADGWNLIIVNLMKTIIV